MDLRQDEDGIHWLGAKLATGGGKGSYGGGWNDASIDLDERMHRQLSRGAELL